MGASTNPQLMILQVPGTQFRTEENAENIFMSRNTVSLFTPPAVEEDRSITEHQHQRQRQQQAQQQRQHQHQHEEQLM